MTAVEILIVVTGLIGCVVGLMFIDWGGFRSDMKRVDAAWQDMIKVFKRDFGR